MKALVTGATGFLGGGLVTRLLETGADVDVLVRDAATPRALALVAAGARAVVADDPEGAHRAVEASQADAVAHLATHYVRSHTQSDIAPLMRANVEFGSGVLDAAAYLAVPVVFASSFFQFRDGAPHPSSLYAASKQAFSTIAEYYRAERGLDAREVVLYDTYGPGDARAKLVPLLTDAARTGEAVRLGSPDQPINLTYLDDVVDGLLTLLTHAAPSITTIRAAQPTSVRELVEVVRSAAARSFPVAFNDAAPVSDLPLAAGDWPTPSGWSPKTDLATGVQRTLAATSWTASSG